MNLGAILISIFILLTLAVGIRASRGVTDIRTFAISKDHFSGYAITCTIVASFIGGAAIIGTAEKAYTQGVAPIIGWLGYCLQLILIGKYVVPKLENFSESISVGDIIQTAYGRTAKVLTGILWVLFCTGIITAQAGALGKVISIFSTLSTELNSIIGISVVITYCYLGGIRSVVATDIIQFIVMFIAMPSILIFSIWHAGGIDIISSRVPADYFEISGAISNTEVFFLFLGFLFGDALIPPMIQRLIMATKITRARNSVISASILMIPLYTIGGILGIVIYSLQPNLSSTELMSFLFNTVLPASVKGIAVAGLVAAIMSSADSYLNSASIALVHDVIKPIRKNSISKTAELNLARATTVIVGFSALVLSLYVKNILDIITNTFKLWGPTIMIPLVAVIFNKKLPKLGFYVCSIVGITTVIIWDNTKELTNLGTDGLVPGVFSSILAYLAITMVSKLTPQNKKIANTAIKAM